MTGVAASRSYLCSRCRRNTGVFEVVVASIPGDTEESGGPAKSQGRSSLEDQDQAHEGKTRPTYVSLQQIQETPVPSLESA